MTDYSETSLQYDQWLFVNKQQILRFLLLTRFSGFVIALHDKDGALTSTDWDAAAPHRYMVSMMNLRVLVPWIKYFRRSSIAKFPLVILDKHNRTHWYNLTREGWWVLCNGQWRPQRDSEGRGLEAVMQTRGHSV